MVCAALFPSSTGPTAEAVATVARRNAYDDIGSAAQFVGTVARRNAYDDIAAAAPYVASQTAERWTKAGGTLSQGAEVSKTLERLRTSKGNFVVLANRYDGIDLPAAACRVLVLDGVVAGVGIMFVGRTDVHCW